MLHIKAVSPDPFLTNDNSQQLARLGHVNAVISEVNGVISGPVAINATATISKEQFGHLVITSTSAAATSLTTPIATDIISILGADSLGVSATLTIDNSAGASIVTLVGGTGVTIQGTATTAIGIVSVYRVYIATSTTVTIIRLN